MGQSCLLDFSRELDFHTPTLFSRWPRATQGEGNSQVLKALYMERQMSSSKLWGDPPKPGSLGIRGYRTGKRGPGAGGDTWRQTNKSKEGDPSRGASVMPATFSLHFQKASQGRIAYGHLHHFKCVELQPGKVKWPVREYTVGWLQSQGARPGLLLLRCLTSSGVEGSQHWAQTAVSVSPMAASIYVTLAGYLMLWACFLLDVRRIITQTFQRYCDRF